MKEVDARRGFVRGVPAVMGGFFGKDLGVIQLVLNRQDGRWVVDCDDTHSEVRPICRKPPTRKRSRLRAGGSGHRAMGAEAHQAAIAYVNTPIGSSACA